MPGLIADANAEGHLQQLLRILQGSGWNDLWGELGFEVVTFADLGLTRETSDDVPWEACQRRQLVLITDNRNRDGDTSLEATIRSSLAADSLPVLTIADSANLLRDRDYAERTAERLLELLLDLDGLRGVGRLYIP